MVEVLEMESEPRFRFAARPNRVPQANPPMQGHYGTMR